LLVVRSLISFSNLLRTMHSVSLIIIIIAIYSGSVISSDDALADLGIIPIVERIEPSDTSDSLSCTGYTYPTGLVTFLSIYGIFLTSAVAYTFYRLRPLIRSALRDNFSFFPRMRADLHSELVYRFWAGSDLITTVRMGSSPPTQMIELGTPTSPPSEVPELSEVIIEDSRF